MSRRRWWRLATTRVGPFSLVGLLVLFAVGLLPDRVVLGAAAGVVLVMAAIAGVVWVDDRRDPNRELWPELRRRWTPLREEVGMRVPDPAEPSPAWTVVDVYLDHERTIAAITCVRFLWGLTPADARDLLRARAAAR